MSIANPYSALGVEPLSVPNYYLCGDTEKWYLVANKNGSPTLRLEYFQNQRQPQIFVQDAPTVGKPFTNDQWVWKCKWRYRAAVTDYRSFYSGQYSS